jgi:hypothetical protein
LGDALDQALVDFAELYADRNGLDYAVLAGAAETGRVLAETALPRITTRRPSPDSDDDHWVSDADHVLL